MKTSSQPLERVSPAELAECPVWEFLPESAHRDETWVQPVRRLPVSSLAGRLVACQVRLANGQSELAILGHVEVDDPKQTEHFLTLSIVRQNGESFDLARYHDAHHERLGPLVLAHFLGLRVSEVFPIEYDISAVATGAAESLRGVIRQQPRVRLSGDELIALALGSSAP